MISAAAVAVGAVLFSGCASPSAPIASEESALAVSPERLLRTRTLLDDSLNAANDAANDAAKASSPGASAALAQAQHWRERATAVKDDVGHAMACLQVAEAWMQLYRDELALSSQRQRFAADIVGASP